MKKTILICDRCKDAGPGADVKEIEVVLAINESLLPRTRFDLCEECRWILRQRFIGYRKDIIQWLEGDTDVPTSDEQGSSDSDKRSDDVEEVSGTGS